jgi:dihydrofolate synthase/folylpolyglutamate synthase
MKLQEKPLVIADSAHNEAGITELNTVIQTTTFKRLHFVFGTVSDKDLTKVFPLLPSNAQYYFCKANIPRGMNADDLQEAAHEFKLEGKAYSNVKEAYNAALTEASKEDLIVVSGSIFVVAEVI